MNSSEILKFCIENGLLLDKEVLGLFSEADPDSVKLLIENLKNYTQKKIITKEIFLQHKERIIENVSHTSEENQKKMEKLKINLGITLEISKEVVERPEIKKIVVEKKEIPSVKVISMEPAVSKRIEIKDFVNYFRGRFSEMSKILQEHSELNNLVSINKLASSRQAVSIIGIVLSKDTTKNKNIILEVEDLTGRIKVLIGQNNKEAYKKAEEICLDSILGFKGSGSREILFANDVVFPESLIQERKRANEEEYAAFIGDLHFGSKLFMKDQFLKFIDYLNGKVPDTPEVFKIKYLFVVGDLITGIGNYPEQEKDLVINNLEEQFIQLANLLDLIRKDITIIISPGNHDAVRIMEPQPFFDEKFAWPLYNIKNVLITSNPATLNIAAKEGFTGMNVLTYHGFSFFHYAESIPTLIQAGGPNNPVAIMQFLLKHRHLAPEHGSTQYFPSEKDGLIINPVPDIFVAAHTHKMGVGYYNNILMISVSTWEALTAYQEKRGSKPDFCKVPLLNLKTRAVKILDFE